MMDSQIYQDAIFELLAKRKVGATICPSEVARRVCATDGNWREAMPVVRSAAGTLVLLGQLEVTQAGQVVDLNTAKGAIRLRLPPRK